MPIHQYFTKDVTLMALHKAALTQVLMHLKLLQFCAKKYYAMYNVITVMALQNTMVTLQQIHRHVPKEDNTLTALQRAVATHC